MNLLKNSFDNLCKILDEIPKGPKILICDGETEPILNVLITKSELYKKEIVSISTMSNLAKQPQMVDQLGFLLCLCFFRSTDASIHSLEDELNNPHFLRYNLYFTSPISEEQIDKIAKADKHSYVQELIEVFIDYSVLSANLFSLNMPDISKLRKSLDKKESLSPENEESLNRIAEGLFSVIASLGLNLMIRYDERSNITEPVAEKLFQLYDLYKSNNSNSRNTNAHADNILVLILDRRNDPVTPLMLNVNTLSFIADIFNINNNVIYFGNETAIINEREFPEQFKFNIESIVDLTKDLSETYKKIDKEHKNVMSSNTEPQEKIDKILEYNNKSNYFSSYLNLLQYLDLRNREALSDVIESVNLIAQSSSNIKEHWDTLKDRISNDNCSPEDALRAFLIFSIRNHTQKQEIEEFKKILRRKNVPENELSYSDILANFAKKSNRGNLFTYDEKHNNNCEIFIPSLENILNELTKKSCKYPIYPKEDSRNFIPDKIIIFYVGGATYLEYKSIYYYKNRGDKTIPNNSVILGGTTIHNAKSFLEYEVDPFVGL